MIIKIYIKKYKILLLIIIKLKIIKIKLIKNILIYKKNIFKKYYIAFKNFIFYLFFSSFLQQGVHS